MRDLSVPKGGVFPALLVGVLTGACLLVFLPVIASNPFFFAAAPLALIFLLMLVVNVKAAVVLLLFLRTLLDPVLELTRIAIFGENIGLGGVLNFFILLLVAVLFLGKPRAVSKTVFSRAGLMFLLVCGLAVIYAPDHGRAVRLWLNLASYMAMGMLPFLLVDGVQEKRFWVSTLLLSSLLPVGFASVDLLTGGRQYEDVGMRILGTFTHPNILAFYLVWVLALAFYALKSGELSLSRAKKGWLYVYMVNVILLLAATQTRNAWIACFGLFFLYGLLQERKYFFFCIVAPFVLILHPYIFERVRDVFVESGTGERLNSFVWRLELWKSALAWILRQFYSGYGLASFEHFSNKFFLLESKGVAAHSTYIELLFETGIAGLGSFIAIYFSILKKFHAGMRKSSGHPQGKGYAILLAYTVSYIVACAADNMLYYLVFNWYFWFFLGLMLKGLELENGKDIRRHPVV